MNDETIQPGDIFIVPQKDGVWGPQVAFVRLDRDNPQMGIFRDASGETVRYFFRDLLDPRCRVGTARRQEPRKRKRKGPSHPITADQRRKIFALAKGRGLSIDDIRDLTPAGSISAMSTGQASRVIDALSGKRVDLTAPTGPTAAPTDAQIAMLYAMAQDAGMDRRHLQNFMRSKFEITGPNDPRLTNAAIQKVLHALRAIANRRVGTAHQSVG